MANPVILRPLSHDAPPPRPATVVPMQACSDDHLMSVWLHGRSPATRRAYAADMQAFFAHVARPLHAVTLGDLQGFQDTLAAMATATEARRLSAVKSLLTFGQKSGYLPVNVGAAIRLPKVRGRPRQPCHYRPLRPRPAQRQLLALPAGVTSVMHKLRSNLVEEIHL